MTREQLLGEALAGAAGHLRLAEQVCTPLANRLSLAARSGRRPSKAECAYASRLARELAGSND